MVTDEGKGGTFDGEAKVGEAKVGGGMTVNITGFWGNGVVLGLREGFLGRLKRFGLGVVDKDAIFEML